MTDQTLPTVRAFIERHLKRTTTSNRFISEVDAFRFVAIAAVIVYHFTQKIAPAVLQGDQHPASHLRRGVHLFFVVSGFILALPFARARLQGSRPVSLASYYLRRLTRLEPPYFVSLALCTGLLIAVKHESLASLMPHLLATALYMHTMWFGALSTINSVAWSLEVEIQFYCVVPLLALIFCVRNTTGRRVLLCALILAAIVVGFYLEPSVRFGHSLLGKSQYFLAGFLLADLYLLHKPESQRFAWDLVALGWLLIFLVPEPVWMAAAPFALVGLYWSVFAGRIANRIFTFWPLPIIGGMCYSIYLIHQQIIAVVAGRIHNPVGIVAAGLALIAVCCTLFYLLIEKPCMDPAWPRKLLARVVGRSSASAGFRPEEELEEVQGG